MIYFKFAEFARDIKDKRVNENNYPLRTLAKELKLSMITLSKLERGGHFPSLGTYYIVCKWLNKDINTYFN